MNEETLKNIFIDPRNVIHIPTSNEVHDFTGTEEQWVKVNAKLIEEMGAQAWLERFLEILKAEPVEVTQDESE